MRIRELRPAEWRELRELRLRALEDAPHAFARTFAEERELPDDEWRDRAAAKPDRVWVVAEASNQSLASLAVAFLTDPQTVVVGSIWVAREHRGGGVGGALLAALVGWACSQRADRMLLEVTASNEPAWRLYARAGFVETGKRRPLPSNPALEVVKMSLRLDPG